MSSTDNAITMQLKQKEKEMERLYKKLPFWTRMWRRVFKRDSFIAGQLVYEPYGMIKGFAAGILAAGGNVLKTFAVIGAAAWEHITTFFEGMVLAVLHSQ